MKFNRISIFYCFAILFAVSFASCGDDDDGGSGNVDCNDGIAVNNAISDEVEAISTALMAYTNDQSAANCDALKDAYQDYIDALKSLQDCADQAGVGAEFAAAITSSEASIDGLIC